MTKIHVIGIGYRPLDKKAREIIYKSGVILASNRLFEVFKGYEEFETVKDKIRVIDNVDKTISFLNSKLKTQNSKLKTIVLLASGDPMFFGIGRRIIGEFDKDTLEMLPDLSSIQIAFSRIQVPWDDAFFMSLHGGPDPAKRRRLEYEIEDIPMLLEKHNKIAILTDKVNNPSVIAKEVLKPSAFSLQPSALKMYVCERLGYLDEKIIEGIPEDIAQMEFSEPNVVVIVRKCGSTEELEAEIKKSLTSELQNFRTSELRFGLKEDKIVHSKGLITKDEIRAVTIHKLRLPGNGIFWDIGAGAGSVSIEVARLCPGLRVFAIEKDDEQIENIAKNKKRFNIANIEIIKGAAPDTLKDLSAPHRVFIGGSEGRLKEIVNFISKKMTSGIIVINATTLETLNEAIICLEGAQFSVDIAEVSISKTKNIGNRRYLSALNPVFIIAGERAVR
ncbi:MAG: precorrin-6y C5,15-methyltransferase (decarboxylating) subunit CbiE [Nitrospirota bacterium]